MMVLDHSSVLAVVLVVADEMLLRMRAINMVEDAGYTSLEAVDADEAVAILESRTDIAMPYTDIQMPSSMDGLTLADAVHNCWPPIEISAIQTPKLRLRRSSWRRRMSAFGCFWPRRKSTPKNFSLRPVLTPNNARLLTNFRS